MPINYVVFNYHQLFNGKKRKKNPRHTEVQQHEGIMQIAATAMEKYR